MATERPHKGWVRTLTVLVGFLTVLAVLSAWVDRQMGKVHSSLASMSTGLADKPWCCNGNHLTLADVAVGCALAYLDFRFAHIDWRGSHANLQRLSEKLFARPSFIDSQPPAA